MLIIAITVALGATAAQPSFDIPIHIYTSQRCFTCVQYDRNDRTDYGNSEFDQHQFRWISPN